MYVFFNNKKEIKNLFDSKTLFEKSKISCNKKFTFLTSIGFCRWCDIIMRWLKVSSLFVL